MNKYGPVGRRIYARIKTTNQTILSMADAIDVAPNTFYSKLREDSFSDAQIRIIADRLNVQPSELLGGEKADTSLSRRSRQLFSETYVALEQALQELGVSLPAEKKARLFVSLCNQALRTGKVDSDTMEAIKELLA